MACTTGRRPQESTRWVRRRCLTLPPPPYGPFATRLCLPAADPSLLHQVSIRLELDEADNSKTEIVAEGGKEELERFAETLKLQEKGMIRVKGIFERS